MPLLIGLLIIVATVYQLFFRYESWPSEQKEGYAYEHDNLTGETRLLKAGVRVDVMARLLGTDKPGLSSSEQSSTQDEGFIDRVDFQGANSEGGSVNLADNQQVEKVARPVPVPEEVVVATSEPPVPMAMLAADVEEARESARPFAVKQVDLNRDGAAEEIIQNAVQSDGLLDISIVRGGREIFYGRGKQIALLPTRSNEGWSDIALKDGKKVLTVFRYNPKDANYKPFKG